jgi:hypothetical protein
MDHTKAEIERLMKEYEVLREQRDAAWAEYKRLSTEADALYRQTYLLWEQRLGFPCAPLDF